MKKPQNTFSETRRNFPQAFFFFLRPKLNSYREREIKTIIIQLPKNLIINEKTFLIFWDTILTGAHLP